MTFKTKIFEVLFMTVLCLSLTACKDDLSGKGSVTVKISHQGLNVGQAVVYLNKDSTYHPDSLNDEFDKLQRADAAGEVQFSNVEPGKYYLYAEGRDPGLKSIVWGTDSIVIKKKFRQNSYDVTINTTIK